LDRAVVVAVVLAAIPNLAQAQDLTPRSMEAYRLPEGAEIRVDGRLDEDVWSAAPSYADWVQKEPDEGSPALNDSRVWLLYDDEALYVGVINYDEDPSSIARNMARRDAAYAGRSDYFEVMIDPNLDGLTAYRFRVTAGGVQTDRYLYADDQEDAAWDAVYESPVSVDERGWVAEFRIPLSQIRYETAAHAQTWGIQFGRRRAADNELTRFSFVSKLRPGRVSQFGRVEGILVNGTAGRFEALPYVVSQAHTGPAVPGDPFFDGRDSETRAGLDVSWGLGTAFTLDATFNPDFGQVEADPAVVNLTAFETFFRERRPFFVEDARVFDFNLSGGQNSLFYSRRIGRAPHGGDSGGADFERVPSATSILGAAKLTGRTNGGLSLGAMVAATQEEKGESYFADVDEFGSFPVEPRSTYGVVRVQQDFRQGQSRVGGIATVARRRLPESGVFDHLTRSAYSAGVDFEHSWGDREWALWGFFSGSRVVGDSIAIGRLQRASNHYRQRPDLLRPLGHLHERSRLAAPVRAPGGQVDGGRLGGGDHQRLRGERPGLHHVAGAAGRRGSSGIPGGAPPRGLPKLPRGLLHLPQLLPRGPAGRLVTGQLGRCPHRRSGPPERQRPVHELLDGQRLPHLRPRCHEPECHPGRTAHENPRVAHRDLVRRYRQPPAPLAAATDRAHGPRRRGGQHLRRGPGHHASAVHASPGHPGALV
jgi:hypothetical protein